MDELESVEITWYADDRTELRDWLLPEIETVATRYRRYTGARVNRIEITIIDERGDTKQMNFSLNRQLAD